MLGATGSEDVILKSAPKEGESGATGSIESLQSRIFDEDNLSNSFEAA